MVQAIIECCYVSEIAAVLTGVKPRRMDNSYRMPAAWRGGDGLNVGLDDSRGCWHDVATGEECAVLDLSIQSPGGTRKEALY